MSSYGREDILRTSFWSDKGIHLSLLGNIGLSGVMGFPVNYSALVLWSQSNTPVIYDTSGLSPGWHHFAIAWDEAATNLYLDGVLIGDGEGNTSEHNALGLSAGEELNGHIDEFAIYDYMKTGDQIEQDFESKSPPHTIPEPPSADANGSYTGVEGSPITLDGSNSSGPSGGTIVAWDWDLDGDSLFDDATGETASYTWGDDYAANIGLKVTDNDGLSDTDTTNVTVSNVAPTVEAGADQTVNQGDTVSLNGSFTDPGWLDTHTMLWNFGDGGTAAGDLEVDHSYADPGTYTVTLTVTDDDGGTGTDTLQVTVFDITHQAPTADANGPYTGVEGSPINLDGSNSSDPNGGTIVAYDWDLDGDSLFDEATGETAAYTWGDDYAADIGLKVTDNDGLSDTTTTTVTVSNVAPTVEAGADQTVNQGDTVSLSGSFTDPGWLDTHTILWNFGDGHTAAGDLEVDHPYADPGTYNVTLTVTDDDGGTGSDSLQVTVVAVSNVAPTVDAGNNQTVSQGDTVNLIGSFTDPGFDDTHTIHWDFGDGGIADGGLEVDHTYTATGTYTVTLTVTDDDEGVGSDTLQVTVVTVSNVAPTVEAGADQTVNPGDTVSLSGGFTDPDLLDTHTILWDFGDENTADGDLTVDHSYADPGIYNVTLTVTDDDVGAGSDTLQVTVIDITGDTRAMLEFQIEKVKMEVSKGKVSVKGTFELDPSGDGVDISEEVVVIMGPFSETIPGGTMVVDKKDKWEYKQPAGAEGIIKKMKIDWKKGKFEFSMDRAALSKLTDPDNVTISIQIGDDFGQKTIAMVITYEYSMPK